MKRLSLVFLVICLSCFLAGAQWKVESVGSAEPNTKLHQIIQTENSTLIYATLEMSVPSEKWVRINRKTVVKTGGMKYKLLNSVNLPIKDEAEKRYLVLPKGNNEVNIVWEFEKFPAEGGFDIVESEKEGNFCFNFRDVKVSPIDSSQVIDTKRFLDSGSPVIAVLYSDKGINYSCLIRDDVCVNTRAVVRDGAGFNNDELFYIEIVNNSDHGIMFDFGKVSVTGHKKKANGDIENISWPKYSPDSYEAYVRELDYEEARNNSSSVLNSVSSQINRDKYANTQYGSWERLGMDALEALSNQAIQNRVEEYMKAHPKTHPSALRNQGIKPGESIHGYVACKRKKGEEFTLSIPMDDFNFTFLFK